MVVRHEGVDEGAHCVRMEKAEGSEFGTVAGVVADHTVVAAVGMLEERSSGGSSEQTTEQAEGCAAA